MVLWIENNFISEFYRHVRSMDFENDRSDRETYRIKKNINSIMQSSEISCISYEDKTFSISVSIQCFDGSKRNLFTWVEKNTDYLFVWRCQKIYFTPLQRKIMSTWIISEISLSNTILLDFVQYRLRFPIIPFWVRKFRFLSSLLLPKFCCKMGYSGGRNELLAMAAILHWSFQCRAGFLWNWKKTKFSWNQPIEIYVTFMRNLFFDS